MDQDNQILHDENEDHIEPGPRSNADATTAADAGLAGGTGAVEGQGTADPTGTFSPESEPKGPEERREKKKHGSVPARSYGPDVDTR